MRRMHRGETDPVISYVERAVAACDGPDDPRRALAAEAIGSMCLMVGRLDEAFDHLGEAARLWRLLGNDHGEVWSLCGRAVSAGNSGNLATAQALTEEARKVAGRGRNPTMMAVTRYAEGESLLEVDPVRAMGPIGEALEFAERAENVFMKGIALVSNTSLRGRHGDPLVALRLFEDVIRHWRRGGNWSQQWLTLRNLVELLTRLGAHEPTAVLYGACTASKECPPLYGPEAARLDVVVSTLVDSLGEETFADAKAHGAALSDDEVFSFAATVMQRLLAEADVSPVSN
jgi:ATP/maltotriose-dependent transcriptional regulator MalT